MDEQVPSAPGPFRSSGRRLRSHIALGATDPVTLNVGYEPDQPVPFSHKIHAGELKMDCRYCHVNVDKAAHATVPPTQTCINCHSPMGKDGAPALSAVHPTSTKLRAVHESWESGESIPWAKIHRLPDFVYFNHAAHVNRGVSCVSCHGRIDTMEKVYQAKELSMAWCLECHNNPDANIRPLSLSPSSTGNLKKARRAKRLVPSFALKTIFILVPTVRYAIAKVSPCE